MSTCPCTKMNLNTAIVPIVAFLTFARALNLSELEKLHKFSSVGSEDSLSDMLENKALEDYSSYIFNDSGPAILSNIHGFFRNSSKEQKAHFFGYLAEHMFQYATAEDVQMFMEFKAEKGYVSGSYNERILKLLRPSTLQKKLNSLLPKRILN